MLSFTYCICDIWLTYSQSDLATGAGLYTEHVDGGEAVAAYSLVYVDANGRWSLADASTVATMPVLGLATEALRAGFKGKVLQQGYANSNTWAWVAGGVIYASDVAGGLSQVAGTVAQVVGMAITGTLIYFDGAGLIASGVLSLTDLYLSGTLYVDTINEYTLNAGVTIEGVLIENGAFTVDSEDQAGEILEPTTTPIGDGHLVRVRYTAFTPDRVVQWIYDLTNTRWQGVELL